ncbi:isoprenylcysteine carboxylmethyltransferase family protein [Roseibaca sp. V10]|uniref:Isoprenylcysteine carboxylmethyltransferase family protein n=1 Tax=Roseinatronobacter domitianus TaxID=2940293 RepID=A0ABT0M139_9RHOB|nr:methyltransferase [Roseibaca domitiana]MCL1628582.1 isoprenylcysteine carboxylmethyltransferase family protein [Roseibaca domitiana]
MRLTLDYPPVWLLGALGLAKAEALLLGPAFQVGALTAIGNLIFWAGLAIMAIAAFSFLRARSTIVPHETPAKLITGGLYRLSRNPIYLADLLLLGGLALVWGSVVGLVLVPVLARILTRRFIEPEEARLCAAFGPEAEAFFQRTRRWL